MRRSPAKIRPQAKDRVEKAGCQACAEIAGSILRILCVEYRGYFGRDGDTLVILLGGGTKKRQQKDIEAAQDLWREYKQRKRQET